MEHPVLHPAYVLRSLAEASALVLVMSKLTWWPLMPWWVLWAPFLAPFAVVAFFAFLAAVRPRGGTVEPEDEPEEPHDPNDDKPRLTSS